MEREEDKGDFSTVEKRGKARGKVARVRGFRRSKQISMPPWPLFAALAERLSALFSPAVPAFLPFSPFHGLLPRDRPNI